MIQFGSVFKRKIERNISSKDLKELKCLMAKYEDRYFGRFVCLAERPKSTLGQNGLKFLLSSLQRSRFLFTGLTDSLNQSNLALGFLAVRAHFETTGSVTYFVTHLQKFYSGKINYVEMDNVLQRLSLGGKNFPADKKSNSRWVDAINVLTLIDEADRVFNNMAGKKEDIFRKSYDFLSEFCHPNLFGLTIYDEILNSKAPPWVIFHRLYSLKKRDVITLISKLFISCHFFFPVYDKCLSLLKNNEKMPVLYKK